MSEPWHAQLQAAIQAVDGLVYKVLVANNIIFWTTSTAFGQGQIAIDPVNGSTWLCRVTHTTPSSGTFAQERTATPANWSAFANSFNPRGQYTNNTSYAYYDMVYDPTLKIIALCTTAYTSGGSPANLNTEAANWAFLAVFPVATTAASISYDHTASGMVAITAQAAIDEDHADLLTYETSNNAAVALKAPIASPVLTGTPTAPTPAVGDNTTNIATTAFVGAAVAATANIANSAVTYAKIQNVTNNRLLGNASGGAAPPSELTGAQVSVLQAAPQVTVYTNGTGTYTVPSGAKYIVVELIGGGGSGSGSGSAATGNAGVATTFGSSLLTANGGAAGSTVNTSIAAGGTATGGDVNLSGGNGAAVFTGGGFPGSNGGVSFYGGAGMGSIWTSASSVLAGGTAVANTGSGGGGANAGTTSSPGGGGGAGGYCRKLIASPAVTYSYAVGAGGAAGSAGSSGAAGGAGGSGLLTVTAYFQ